MVGRFISRKYRAMASSNWTCSGSRGWRVETSAWVCTSMATSSSRFRFGWYLAIRPPLCRGGLIRKTPRLRKRVAVGPLDPDAAEHLQLGRAAVQVLWLADESEADLGHLAPGDFALEGPGG